MQMKGKTIVVTGGAGDIGKALCLRFANEGANIVVADINGAGAEKVASDIRAIGADAIAVNGDLADEDQVRKLVDEVIAKYGKVDVLINSAGSFEEMPMMDITVEYWDRMFKDNLRNMFLCIRDFGNVMAKQGYGRIINISSTAGERGRINQVAYCAAKGGVETLTMSSAIQLSPLGINVNAIAPGILETSNGEKLDPDMNMENYTIGRMPINKKGSVNDVTGAALFLAGSESDYITGHTIVVDGGLTCRLNTCGEDR